MPLRQTKAHENAARMFVELSLVGLSVPLLKVAAYSNPEDDNAKGGNAKLFTIFGNMGQYLRNEC